VPDVRLHPVKGQDHATLLGQQASQPRAVPQPHRQQLVVAVQQVGDRPLADGQASARQFQVDLGHAAVLPVSQRPDQRDHVQAELVLRQRHPPLLLRAVRPVIQRAIGGLAVPHVQA